MPFAIAAAAVGAVGAVAASSIQAGATKSAANSAIAAQEQANNQATALLQPYNTAGQNALGVTSDLSGANGLDAAKAAQGNYLQSPGYQWQLGEGLRGVDAGAASKGMLRSGAAIKGEIGYAEGLAKQDFNTYYNNLYNLSTLGENAAAKTGSNAITTGQGIAGTTTSAGTQLASIAGNTGQQLSSGVGQLSSTSQNSLSGLFSGNGALGANSLNSNFGTQFGAGTFPSASNPNATPAGFQADTFTPI